MTFGSVASRQTFRDAVRVHLHQGLFLRGARGVYDTCTWHESCLRKKIPWWVHGIYETHGVGYGAEVCCEWEGAPKMRGISWSRAVFEGCLAIKRGVGWGADFCLERLLPMRNCLFNVRMSQFDIGV
jgi:hypothetical protein